MPKRILIDAVYPEETRVVIHENKRILEFDYETAVKKQLKGNIYLAKVTRVEPSLQAAFVDYGGDKHGFLPFSEIHPDYYQVPISDRSRPEAETAANIESSPEDAHEAAPHEDIGLQIRAITPPDLSQDEQEEEIPPAAPIEMKNAVEFVEDAPEESTERTIAAQAEHSELLSHLAENEPENAGKTSAKKYRVAPEATSDHTSETEHGDTHLDDDDAAGDTDDEPYASSKRSNLYRQYKIQEVIKRNQIILVQVIKEERGNKGASLTSYISLAGRYCVLMPNSDRQGGISRRISDPEDRKRLKSIIEGLDLPDGTSVIVRTAGASRGKVEIKRDYDYLVRLWNSIREHTLSSKAPAFIHAESDLIKRTIRDLYDNTVEEIQVQGEKAFRTAKDFMKMIMPRHVGKVKPFKGKVPIFCRYQVEEQLSCLYSPTSTLESGGYIVINPTEALISIDVNSGRSTSERNIEETATKTNLEAAYELARQLRLRDLSGLIVVDFIDMMESRNRRAVEKALKDALEGDRAKIQIGRISPFGLLEMSRQRLRPSFLEANTITCPHCTGRGFVRASESTAIMVLRAVENEICKADCEAMNIYASTETVIYILNYKRVDLQTIEERYNVRIFLHQDPHASADSFSTEKIKRYLSAPKAEAASLATMEYTAEPIDTDETVDEVHVIETAPSARKRSWRRGGRQTEAVETTEQENAFSTATSADNTAAEGEEGENASPRKRHGRGSRNRHNNRRNRKGTGEASTNAGEETSSTPSAESIEKTTVGSTKEEGGMQAAPRRRYRRRGSSNSSKTEEAATQAEPRKVEESSLLKGLWKRIID